MEMLRAAGMPILGGAKSPYSSHPRESWVQAKLSHFTAQKDQTPEAAGHATFLSYQSLSTLLSQNGNDSSYRILNLRRPLSQIRASRAAASPHDLTQTLEEERSQLEQTLKQLQKSPRVEMVNIDYPDLVLRPNTSLRQMTHLLQGLLPIPQALVLPIKPELFHHRE